MPKSHETVIVATPFIGKGATGVVDSKKSKTSLNDLSLGASLDVIYEVAKVNHLDYLIGVFTDKPMRNPPRFFYDPVVVLDPKTIVSESHEFLKKNCVRFTIQMWNPEIRSKVLARLKALPGLADFIIGEDDIYVMPYLEVQLVYKADSLLQSIQLTDQIKPYLQLNKALDFEIRCDSSSTAAALAKDFQLNPKMILESWELALECRGLALGNGANPLVTMPRTLNINLSSIPSEEAAKKKWTSVVPVFSVKRCTNPTAKNRYFAFAESDFPTKTEHGVFDDRIFVIKTPGIYQFQFTAHVRSSTNYHNNNSSAKTHHVELHAKNENNSILFATRSTSGSVKNPNHNGNGKYSVSAFYDPVVLTALWPLNAGERVGVFIGDNAENGEIYETDSYVSRFSAILFAEM